MDNQIKINTLNEVLALLDNLCIFGSDAGLLVSIKEKLLTIGNSIIQEINKSQTEANN